MKTKTWKVMTTTGKQADLESGLEKKEIQKPAHISARDFVHWLAAESHIDDNSIAFAIQAVRTPARERVPPSATRKFPLPDSFAAGDHPLELCPLFLVLRRNLVSKVDTPPYDRQSRNAIVRP